MLLVAVAAGAGLCDPVDPSTARQAAEGKLRHHLILHGTWNGSTSPQIVSENQVVYEDGTVAYSFAVQPSGHILVSVDDDFSPVPLYSTRGSFDPARVEDPNSVEAWIIPELGHKVSTLNTFRRGSGGNYRSAVSAQSHSRIKGAWSYFTSPDGSAASMARSLGAFAAPRGAPITVGPLLTTTWGQQEPYNLLAPPDESCARTLAGCVALAWAQVLRYHQWPDKGVGTHSYTWNGQTLSADFSTPYDWGNMPAVLTASSSAAEKAAVSQLVYHLGVASDTDFGCDTSNSSAFADKVLDAYFKYKAMGFHDREDYADDGWFSLLKSELDARRPVILSIFTALAGHEVVVDGYQQDAPADMVHINFGWLGSDDNYYNVSENFSAGGHDWLGNNQYAVTGIEPYRGDLPAVNAGVDQIADEYGTVQLSGAVTSQTSSIASYQWSCVSHPLLLITDKNNPSASFRAPAVSGDTEFVFLFKAVNTEGGVGSDEVRVTVRDDGVTSPPPQGASNSSSSSGGGGGCFISASSAGN